MESYVIPANIKKTIRFPRLTSENVLRYEIYTRTVDDTYDSGIRIDLIDTIENPIEPAPIKDKIDLEYSNNATWELPNRIYMDRDHDIIVLVDDIQISKLHYTINKTARMFTINTNAITINPDTKVSIIYYQDIIEKVYTVEQDCEIFVRPIIIDYIHFGNHNMIL